MHSNFYLIKTEYSVIRDLSCYQHAAGQSEVTCQWIAEPSAPFYEIMFTMTDGSEILREDVEVNAATVELNNLMGELILVSVRNASTEIRLMGTSIHIQTIIPKSAYP